MQAIRSGLARFDLRGCAPTALRSDGWDGHVDVSVPRDRATGRPRGFAFVTLSTEDESRGARDLLDGSMQSGSLDLGATLPKSSAEAP